MVPAQTVNRNSQPPAATNQYQRPTPPPNTPRSWHPPVPKVSAVKPGASPRPTTRQSPPLPAPTVQQLPRAMPHSVSRVQSLLGTAPHRLPLRRQSADRRQNYWGSAATTRRPVVLLGGRQLDRWPLQVPALSSAARKRVSCTFAALFRAAIGRRPAPTKPALYWVTNIGDHRFRQSRKRRNQANRAQKNVDS